MRPDRDGCEAAMPDCPPEDRPDVRHCTSRQSAIDVLRQKARVLRDRAHAMEKLADEVCRLSPEADAALWEMVVSSPFPR